MDDNQIRHFQRATRSHTFCLERAADISLGSTIATNRDALSVIIAKLEENRVGQLRAPVSKSALIEALTADFKDIARTARAIRIADPHFSQADFRRPRERTETAVATHADALLLLLEDQPTDTAEQKATKAALRARFIAYELPADFVEDLRADRDALDQRNQLKHADNQEGVQSTAEIDENLAKARKIILQLDAAILNKYRNDPATITTWKSASRVARTPRKTKPDPEQAPPAPSANPGSPK